ncbi:MAG: phage head-tail joining protein [Sphingomonas sp.]
MAYSQADLDNIRSCIASGVMETRFADGRMVRYQTLSDMMNAEQRIAAAVAASSPSTRRRCRTPIYRNGL